MRIVTVLALVCVCGGGLAVQGTAPSDAATYANPFELPEEWPAYGVGDPFILRWNGRYYLYPSTNTHFGGSVGIKAWSSVDLVNWRYEGLVTEDPVSRNAYAPEVVYWNGKFYLYTSPDGQGHYVFVADSPTGPFTAVTGNLGMTIDGSVFIDDDGTWIFTHAGHLGIRGRRMRDPFTFGPEQVVNSNLGGWTEGSYILKRDGGMSKVYWGRDS
ncbi:MAG: family 43 glycosylhydrolase [Firmicutes bacterium]|nr:family 43 glycosylhydrolase [Bacillota bacterium]